MIHLVKLEEKSCIFIYRSILQMSEVPGTSFQQQIFGIFKDRIFETNDMLEFSLHFWTHRILRLVLQPKLFKCEVIGNFSGDWVISFGW